VFAGLFDTCAYLQVDGQRIDLNHEGVSASGGAGESGAGAKNAGEGGRASELCWEEEQDLMRQMETISQKSSTQ
jgi:hypothetical protein